jgi:hypothetical protein
MYHTRHESSAQSQRTPRLRDLAAGKGYRAAALKCCTYFRLVSASNIPHMTNMTDDIVPFIPKFAEAAAPRRTGPRLPDAHAPATDPHTPVPEPAEIGGPAGPEPTRFGDWERNGRCTDF